MILDGQELGTLKILITVNIKDTIMKKIVFILIIICVFLGFWKFYYRYKIMPNMKLTITSDSFKQQSKKLKKHLWVKAINDSPLFNDYFKTMRKKNFKGAPYLQFGISIHEAVEASRPEPLYEQYGIKTIKTRAKQKEINLYISSTSTNKNIKDRLNITVNIARGPQLVIKPDQRIRDAAIVMIISHNAAGGISKELLKKACSAALNADSESQRVILESLQKTDISKSPICAAWLIDIAKKISSLNRAALMKVLIAQSSMSEYEIQITTLCVRWLHDKDPEIRSLTSRLLTKICKRQTAKHLISLLNDFKITPEAKIAVIITIANDSSLSDHVKKLLLKNMQEGGPVGLAAADTLFKQGCRTTEFIDQLTLLASRNAAASKMLMLCLSPFEAKAIFTQHFQSNNGKQQIDDQVKKATALLNSSGVSYKINKMTSFVQLGKRIYNQSITWELDGTLKLADKLTLTLDKDKPYVLKWYARGIDPIFDFLTLPFGKMNLRGTRRVSHGVPIQYSKTLVGQLQTPHPVGFKTHKWGICTIALKLKPSKYVVSKTVLYDLFLKEGKYKLPKTDPKYQQKIVELEQSKVIGMYWLAAMKTEDKKIVPLIAPLVYYHTAGYIRPAARDLVKRYWKRWLPYFPRVNGVPICSANLIAKMDANADYFTGKITAITNRSFTVFGKMRRFNYNYDGTKLTFKLKPGATALKIFKVGMPFNSRVWKTSETKTRKGGKIIFKASFATSWSKAIATFTRKRKSKSSK